MLLQLLAYLGTIVGFCALVFLVATALYYISEELEAHTVLAKRYIVRYIYAVMGCHVALWLVDGLPLKLTVWSLIVNWRYLCVMGSFPVVNFGSVNFLLAGAGAITNHFFWFWYFNDANLPPSTIYDRLPDYDGKTLAPFSQVASFFGLLVWTVPFLLFLSLSANDNTLPLNNERSKPQRKGLAKHMVEQAWHKILDLLPDSIYKRTQEHIIPR